MGSNSIHILESGVAKPKVAQNPDVLKDGKLVYDGMSAIISSTSALENVTLYDIKVTYHSLIFLLIQQDSVPRFDVNFF